ncbi:AraC family transcriptional regulator [Clostridioides difficile]
MNLIDLNYHLPLSEVELTYKNIFLNNPQFELNKPKTPKMIDSFLEKLNIDSFLKKLNLDIEKLKDPSKKRSNKESMNETLFPKENDVIISKHLRYSPCFIHSHSFFEIIFVLNGFCTNELENYSVNLKKGDVCIMAPNTSHAISIFTDDCLVLNLLIRSSTFEKSFFEIIKSNDILSSFFSHSLYSNKSESYLLFTNQNDPQIINLALEMYEEFNNNLKYSDRMLRSMMSSFFIKLLRSDSNNIIVPNPIGSHTDKNVMHILNYILSNYKEISLSELSIKFNYSERQMSRILKEYTGKTFINIIQDIKLQNACDLLKNPDISINKIIDTIGYSNSTHFYKIFKKAYGVTPIDYRNLNITSI